MLAANIIDEVFVLRRSECVPYVWMRDAYSGFNGPPAGILAGLGQLNRLKEGRCCAVLSIHGPTLPPSPNPRNQLENRNCISAKHTQCNGITH
jgi:molybdopterin-guanine dinucleotide biosynthesis protein A